MLFFAELIFGFAPDTYSIDEAEKEVVFSVSLINGTLAREVAIQFFTEDGTAFCTCNLFSWSHEHLKADHCL